MTAAGSGLANYPMTAGAPALREALARWLVRRHNLPSLDPATQVLPVLGSREALFAFAQTVVDASRVGATVVTPNPFYQIYEGAALLAGADALIVSMQILRHRFAPAWDQGPPTRSGLARSSSYVCSPDNPTGRVTTLAEWQRLFELSDRYGFVIAADECYSEGLLRRGEAPRWAASRQRINLGAQRVFRDC